jgi:hypothetical protein
VLQRVDGDRCPGAAQPWPLDEWCLQRQSNQGLQLVLHRSSGSSSRHPDS